METGRRANKVITAVDGTGLNQSAATAHKTVGPMSHRVTTAPPANYVGEDDSFKALTGPGDGDYASDPGRTPHRWGHTAPSGSRVEINDSNGMERIEMVHHTGAAVSIDPDGSVYVTSTSTRGGGMIAPFGDFYISAGGSVVIDGAADVSIKTKGNLALDVGGMLSIRCDSYNLVTKTSDETIDGSASRSVTNDQSEVIGGISRQAIAGDARQQISGKYIQDVAGTSTTKIDGDTSVDVGGKMATKIASDNNLDVGGNDSTKVSGHKADDVGGNSIVRAGGQSQLHAGGSATIRSGEETAISSGSDFSVRSGGSAGIGASGTVGITGDGGATYGSGGTTKIVGADTAISGGTASMDGGAVSITGGAMELNAPAVNINTNTLIAPVPSGSPGAGGAPNVESMAPATAPDGPDGPAAAEGPEEADVVEANDIVDELTSARKYPEYLGNGRLESAHRAGVGRGSVPQAEEVYNEYSSGNQNVINASYPGGSYETLGEEPVNRPDGIEVIDPGIEPPSAHNTGMKISKYFTLGELTNAPHSDKIPPSKWDQVVKNHILLATNVLDPIKEKFPDMIITNAFRTDSSNHITGRTADIVVENRSLTRHAEIARFARDNLPVEKVLLEKNDSGKTHVHVGVAPTGFSGNPKVYTCGNASCSILTPGIDVEYLVRKGVSRT